MNRTTDAAPNCTVTYDPIELSLFVSFAELPVSKMVILAQLDDPRVKDCVNWDVLELRLQRALHDRLTGVRVVELGSNFGFILRPWSNLDCHRVLEGLEELLRETGISTVYSLEHLPPVNYR